MGNINLKRRKTRKVLVTGFLPFLENPVNPSELVAQELNGSILSTPHNKNNTRIKIHSEILPVDSNGSQFVSKLVQKYHKFFKYDFVIHLGLNEGSENVHIELCGLNHSVQTGKPVRVNSPMILNSTIDINNQHLQEYVWNNMELVEFSRDAGTYYCNETLYSTLHSLIQNRVIASGSKVKYIGACFVHLPPLDRINLDMQVKVVEEILQRVIL